MSATSSTGSTGAAPLSLDLDPNPNNVLSAVAQVQWPPGVTEVGVHVIDMQGNDAGYTPFLPTGAFDPLTLPVLMLQPQTTYMMQAVGNLADGGEVLSAAQTYTTLPLPALVPHYDTTNNGIAPDSITLVAQNAAPNVEQVDAFSNDIVNYAAAVDASGNPVWYLTFPQGQGLCGDLQKQPDGTYTAALYDPTFGPFAPVDAPGIYYQYDDLGNLIHIWKSPDGWATNEHDFRILPDGTALLLGIVLQYIDMTQYTGGQPATCTAPATTCDGGYVCDQGICKSAVYSDKLEQVDVNGNILWSWDELQHIPITDTSSLNGSIIDATHTNAIEIADDGNYILSMRNMSHIVKLNKTDGGVMWILGGVQDSFQIVDDPLPNPGPSFQHGVRELPNGHIIMFDNGWYHNPFQDRGVEYALDLDAGTATMVWEYDPSPPLQAVVFGLSQRLDNGNTLVTFGSTGEVREVNPDGGVVWILLDDQKVLYPDGGLGVGGRDWGIYRSWRLDTVY